MLCGLDANGLCGSSPRATYVCGDPRGQGRTSLTFFAQEEGVEAEMVDAEVQPALAWHPALPAAARVVGDQLLCLGEVEPGHKLHQGLPELLGLLLLLSQSAAGLLSNQGLWQREEDLMWGRGEVASTGGSRHPRNLHRTTAWLAICHLGTWPEQ